MLVIRRIVLNAYLRRTNQAAYYTSATFTVWPCKAYFRPGTTSQRAVNVNVNENNITYWNRAGNVWGGFGANQVHFRSKIGTPRIAVKYDGIICALRIYACFTVLNVQNDCMKHPCLI